MADGVAAFSERERSADLPTRTIPSELQLEEESILHDRRILAALIAALIACAVLAKADWSDAVVTPPTAEASAIGSR